MTQICSAKYSPIRRTLTAMKTIAELSTRELIELNYKVAYYVAQNAIAEGITSKTIRVNALKMEKFERGLKNEWNDSIKLGAINRVAKWMGIEDAIAGRAENPQIDDFGEIESCSCEFQGRQDEVLTHPVACEDDDSGSKFSIC
jgi:hypothetical protein